MLWIYKKNYYEKIRTNHKLLFANFTNIISSLQLHIVSYYLKILQNIQFLTLQILWKTELFTKNA